jgi:protein-S-isoprenylcysteine O-methyltransferase Ste14
MKEQLRKIGLAAMVGALIGAVITRWHGLPDGIPHLHFSTGMRLSLGLWVLFSIYWSIAAKDQAPTATSESVWSRQFHVILVNAALLLLVFPVPGLTQRILPASPLLAGVGLAVQTAFIFLAISARRHLGANWSGEVRIASGHALVRSGPYQVVRHPIYTGLAGMYLGTILVSGELHGPIALVLMMVVYTRKIRMEEQALSQAFGPDHAAWRAETWAWIPGLY